MNFLIRRQNNKGNDAGNAGTGVFNRYLTLTNLIFLCISSSIGSGIYVLTGIASAEFAGQYIPFAFLLAAIPCFLAALCYAEFSARVFSSGSGYSFVYYSLGEIFAFVLGWSNIVSSIAAFSATSLTWSHYFDALFDNRIKNFTTNSLHLHWNASEPFNNYIDLPAIGILTILFSISLLGIEYTAFFSNILAVVNTCVLVLITAAGFAYGKKENLTSTPYTNGIHGVVKGASIILYAYIGFESSTFAITEAKNPARDVPLSMLVSLTLICAMYSSVSFSLNFMQNFKDINKDAPFPVAFQHVKWMHVVASVGPVFSLTGTLLTSIFSFARIIYAMANDGLFFQLLAKVHSKFKVPHIAMLFGFVFSVVLLILLDIKDLLGFADICGFLSYVLVSVGLLVIRYCPAAENTTQQQQQSMDDEDETTFIESRALNFEEISEPLLSEFDEPILEHEPARRRTLKNKRTNKKLALNIIFFAFIFNLFLSGLFNYTKHYDLLIILLIVACNTTASVLLAVFCEQNSDKKEKKIVFKVPFVPFVPIASMALNIFFMMSSAFKDWIVFLSIIFLGLPIYFLYGIQHSRLN